MANLFTYFDGALPRLFTEMKVRKHIYLPHAQTAIYDSKVKLFLKQGISCQLGRDVVVRFDCENSAIDVNFFYPFKTQGRIIFGRTVLVLNSVHIG
jgi:hypothetical protein